MQVQMIRRWFEWGAFIVRMQSIHGYLNAVGYTRQDPLFRPSLGKSKRNKANLGIYTNMYCSYIGGMRNYKIGIGIWALVIGPCTFAIQISFRHLATGLGTYPSASGPLKFGVAPLTLEQRVLEQGP